MIVRNPTWIRESLGGPAVPRTSFAPTNANHQVDIDGADGASHNKGGVLIPDGSVVEGSGNGIGDK